MSRIRERTMEYRPNKSHVVTLSTQLIKKHWSIGHDVSPTFSSTTNQQFFKLSFNFWNKEKTNVWREWFDKEFDCGARKPKLWTTILHTIDSSPSLSLSHRWAWEKTMVGDERWRGGLCYASSMACHCAYYAFSVSPQRDFINKTKLKPSARSKPVLLSSISSTRASYNTLVSEVLFSFPSLS